MVRITIVGDIHGCFAAGDVEALNRSAAELVLFVGDLPEHLPTPGRLRAIAQLIAGVQKPAILIPGNHDVHNPFQLLAELFAWRWLAWLSGRRHPALHRQLGVWLGPVSMGGYSTHSFPGADTPFDVIVARPYAMGGSSLSYATILAAVYDVESMEQSIVRLKRCVDAALTDTLIFLAHNGPSNLGSAPDDIWGRDFGPAAGDWGDMDLRAAINYAQENGKRVAAVIAGHMHRLTRQGVQRQWHIVRSDANPGEITHYLNCAVVPRIMGNDGRRRHHTMSLHLSANDVVVSDNWE